MFRSYAAAACLAARTAVKAFMGDDYEVAHVPAQAQAVLADFEKRATHYQVLDRRDQPSVTGAGI